LASILSIQSHVAYGHVGNGAAAFALQRLGHEAWAVPTVDFSNHPAHGGAGGRINGAAIISGMVDGLDERGFLGGCDAVLSGYMGSVHNAATTVEVVAQVRRANSDVRYLCDPVMGHEGRGIFVAEGLPEFFRDKAVAAADIVTPNQFELEWLTGRKIATLENALGACAELLTQGPGMIVCTSLRRDEREAGRLETLLVSGKGAWICAVPELTGDMFGAGDLFAAVFLGHLLTAEDEAEALSRAVSACHAVLAATVEKMAQGGDGELALIAAQDELAMPPKIFQAEKVG
jgi:pyridoxine kinase